MHRARLNMVFAALAVLFALARGAHAHPGVFATALVKVQSDGQVTVTVRHDALAFALDTPPDVVRDEPMVALLDGPDNALTTALDGARERFRDQFMIEVDGVSLPFEVAASPSAADVREWERGLAVRTLPVRLDFVARAHAPPGAHTLTVAFPASMGDVITTFDRDEQEPFAIPVSAGTPSPPIEIVVKPTIPQTDLPPSAGTPAPQRLSAPAVTGRYIALGFTHILPHGLDHVLFVLGLFLLSPKLKPLLWQVTAFTLAHTITLALTVLGKLPAAPAVIEPVIAASIAFVAIENVVTSRVHPWRPAIVFAFGLVHGMGFAGVLKDAGLPPGQLANSLVSFNVGVEFGQLAVISLALLLVGWFRDRPWYRARVTTPVSILIALVAIYWTICRVLP